MKCFKLVQVDSGEMFSLFVPRTSKYRLHYDLKKKTIPETGKIFVYKSAPLVEDLVQLAREALRFEVRVLKCECGGLALVEDFALVTGTDPRAASKRIREFWIGEYEGEIDDVRKVAYVTDWVRPIEICQF